MPSFGACPVRARNEAFVVNHYECVYGVPVVKGGGRARAHSINDAARRAVDTLPERDVFIICDNDLIPDPVTFPQAVGAVDMVSGVTPHNINRNLSEASTVTFMRTGAMREFEDVHKGARSFVVMTRENFALVNGLDEMFIGWGPEDASFIQSVTKQVGPMLHLDGVRLHLWHPVDPSKSNVKQLRMNRARFRRYARFPPERVAALAREFGRWDDGATYEPPSAVEQSSGAREHAGLAQRA